MKIMKRIGSALAAAAVAAVSMSSFAVFAQEDNTVVKRDPSKNYEYYKSLSDKEVYNEMCKAYGLEPSDAFEPNCGLSYGSLPDGTSLPFLGWAVSTFVYIDHEFMFYVNNSYEIGSKAEDVSYFGFDEEYSGSLNVDSSNFTYNYPYDVEIFVIDVDFGKDSKLHAKNITDFYRVYLTLANSQFAVDCCGDNDVSKDLEKFNRGLCGSMSSIDANGDGLENIDDALHILRVTVGLNKTSDLEDCTKCDVDYDGAISSNDALEILEYIVGLNYRC